MCGFLGYFKLKNDHVIDFNQVEEALSLLYHRGPDAFGIDKNENYFLGHRRLSIIDLTEKSNQPYSITKDSRTATIVYNGEIYNYKDLAKKYAPNELVCSDTQTLLLGYLLKGESFFSEIRGIYSFAILDSGNRLILYRDPAGVKPLYYFLDGSRIIFSSEIKAIKKSLNIQLSYNEEILKTYLALGYCLEPMTAYNEIFAVEPGQLIEINLENGTIRKQIIFRYDFSYSKSDKLNNYVENTNRLINQAVERNLVADVSLEFALSGGIDSSLLFAKANKNEKKYTGICVGFDDVDYDESKKANFYANILNSPIENIKVHDEGNLKKLNQLLLHFDQPYADSSAIPFNLLSMNAAQRTKILVGGDGGDEIHNGYSSYYWMPFVWKFRFFKRFLFSLCKIIDIAMPNSKSRIINRLNGIINNKTLDDAVCEWQSWLSPKSTFNKYESPWLFDTKVIYKTFSSCFSEIKAESIETAMLKNYFYKQLLSDYLRKTDMMSMYHSLEYRVPMLDEDLVSYSLSIPYKHKHKFKKGKRILRKIHSEVFPKKMSNSAKSGFTIPLDTWLSKSDLDYMQSYLKKENGILCKWIKKEYIDYLFDKLNIRDFKEVSRESLYQRILIFYSLQLWYFNQ